MTIDRDTGNYSFSYFSWKEPEIFQKLRVSHINKENTNAGFKAFSNIRNIAMIATIAATILMAFDLPEKGSMTLVAAAFFAFSLWAKNHCTREINEFIQQIPPA